MSDFRSRVIMDKSDSKWGGFREESVNLRTSDFRHASCQPLANILDIVARLSFLFIRTVFASGCEFAGIFLRRLNSFASRFSLSRSSSISHRAFVSRFAVLPRQRTRRQSRSHCIQMLPHESSRTRCGREFFRAASHFVRMIAKFATSGSSRDVNRVKRERQGLSPERRFHGQANVILSKEDRKSLIRARSRCLSSARFCLLSRNLISVYFLAHILPSIPEQLARYFYSIYIQRGFTRNNLSLYET